MTAEMKKQIEILATTCSKQLDEVSEFLVKAKVLLNKIEQGGSKENTAAVAATTKK